MSCKVVVSLLLTLFAVVNAQSWCDVQSCKTYDKGTHTMCAHPTPGPQQRCFAKGNLEGGVSNADKYGLLRVHNEFRQKVASGAETRGSNGPQPAAKPGTMPNLEWDRTLEAIAQRWADQCDYKHDSCRDVSAYQVGQNIGYRGTTANVNTIDILDIARSWCNEVQYFDKNEVPNFSGKTKGANNKDIGHYTQVVWAKTRKIGCGIRNYYEKGFNRRYLVCNYGPSGNFPDHAIYET